MGIGLVLIGCLAVISPLICYLIYEKQKERQAIERARTRGGKERNDGATSELDVADFK